MHKFSPITIVRFFLTTLLFLQMSCGEKQLIDKPEFPALKVTDIDAAGGNWKTMLISSPKAIKVPAPSAILSESYQNELKLCHFSVNHRTYAQNVAINYWGSGGVLRWNQIATELIAKYNTNDLQIKSNPSNPGISEPFAARVLALLSAAQYDALVTAWYYKFKYKRMPPYLHGSGEAVLPQNSLPSYPSEDAVVASVSYKILSYLFPAEKSFLYKKAIEHGNTRLWAGVNVSSDIVAGGKIGQETAQLFINFARNDFFDQAGQLSPDLKRMPAKSGKNWNYLRDLLRHPVLPMMGKVKPLMPLKYHKDDPQILPEKIADPAFQRELEELKKISQKLNPAQRQILEFWDNELGSPTIAGHWNKIAKELIRPLNYTELRSAKVFAMLNCAQENAAISGWDIKYRFLIPRPSQADPTIKPTMGVPDSPSFVSEYAVFSFTSGIVLGHLFPKDSVKIMKMAEEAGFSTIYGGINFRSDYEKGKLLGEKIGRKAINPENWIW